MVRTIDRHHGNHCHLRRRGGHCHPRGVDGIQIITTAMWWPLKWIGNHMTHPTVLYDCYLHLVCAVRDAKCNAVVVRELPAYERINFVAALEYIHRDENDE